MQRDMDMAGAAGLVGFAVLLAFNQVVIKVTNEGAQPVFLAGLRSLGAAACLYGWMRLRGLPLQFPGRSLRGGVLIGLCFTCEFVCLFTALDLTTVSRSVVIFYTMPIWLALLGHVLLPDDRLSLPKLAGLALACAGVAVAIGARGAQAGQASLAGDLLALGASVSWAGIALCARATGLREVRPEMQLLWQLGVSAPLLLLLAPLFGPLLRDPASLHLWGLGFQTVVVAFGGFLFWLWLISVYRPSAVASFSFLTPVFGVAMGWAFLGEAVGADLLGALLLVAAGLWLINRRRQVPQKV